MSSAETERRRHGPGAVLVSILIGAVFVLAGLLTLALPGIAAAYVVTSLPTRGAVPVLVVWAISAVVTVVSFLAISETFIGVVLGRRLGREPEP